MDINPLPRYVGHLALDNGHNAFNAFVLGFVDLVLADEHYQLSQNATKPHYQALLQRAQEQLKLSEPTWAAFVAYLKINKKNPEQLQQDLGPVFRSLAVDWYDHDELVEFIQEQFDEYAYVLLDRMNVEQWHHEVLFKQHAYIQPGFNEIAQSLLEFKDSNIDDETLDQIIHGTCFPQLTEWWEKKGCDEFKATMRRQNVWGRTLELGTLGRALDIDIIISLTHKTSDERDSLRPSIFLRHSSENNWLYMQDSDLGRLVISSNPNRPLMDCFADSIAHLPKRVGTHHHISAHPDGNCAFNGFVLGFCDRLLSGVLDQFSELPAFLRLREKACQSFSLLDTSLEALKGYVRKYDDNPILLQQSFAPFFRRFAAELYERQDLLPALSAEFREFAFRLLGIHIPERGFKGGDIFRRIDFIQEKFKQFQDTILEFKDYEVDAAILDDVLAGCFTQIREWWEQEGLARFKVQMNQSGEWAGDMELGYLGDLFQINVKLGMPGQFRSINECYGFLPLDHGFSDEQLAQLKQRGVIKLNPEADGRYGFREISAEQLGERLHALQFHEAILDYFVGQDTGEILDAWIPGLKARDLIMQERGRYRFIDDIDFDTLFSRICEFEHPARVIGLHAAHYRPNPCLAFSNPMAAHWYYEQEVAMAKLNLTQAQRAPTPRSTPTPNPGRVRQALFAEDMSVHYAGSDREVVIHADTDAEIDAMVDGLYDGLEL